MVEIQRGCRTLHCQSRMVLPGCCLAANATAVFQEAPALGLALATLLLAVPTATALPCSPHACLRGAPKASVLLASALSRLPVLFVQTPLPPACLLATVAAPLRKA